MKSKIFILIFLFLGLCSYSQEPENSLNNIFDVISEQPEFQELYSLNDSLHVIICVDSIQTAGFISKSFTNKTISYANFEYLFWISAEHFIKIEKIHTKNERTIIQFYLISNNLAKYRHARCKYIIINNEGLLIIHKERIKILRNDYSFKQ